MIWAFGAAKFPHNSIGSASSPIWQFRALLAALCLVVLVNEYNTSKRCSRCRCPSLTMTNVRVPGEKKALHGVLECAVCPGKVNRDINSARNILYCFWFQLSQRGARPPGFSPAKSKLPTVNKRGRIQHKQQAAKPAGSGSDGNAPKPPTRQAGSRPSSTGPADSAAPANRGASTTRRPPSSSSTSSRAPTQGNASMTSGRRKQNDASEAAPAKIAGKGRNRNRQDLTSDSGEFDLFILARFRSSDDVPLY